MAELPRLGGEVDALEVRQVTAAEVVSEAINLNRLWPRLASDQKRKLIGSIVEKMVISEAAGVVKVKLAQAVILGVIVTSPIRRLIPQ